MLYYEPLQSKDFIDEWSCDLRLQDKIEIGAINQNKEYIKTVITSALEKSRDNYVLYNDNSVLSIYGVKDMGEKIGMPWFLSTEIPEIINNDFFKISKRIVEGFKQEYNILYNYTYYNNTKSHKWLEFLGFKIIHEDVIKKFDGRKLVRFEWRREWEN